MTSRAIQRVRRVVHQLRPPQPPAEPPPPPEPSPPRDDGPPPREALLRALERGRSVDHAIVNQVRALIGAQEHDAARSIGESLAGYRETRELGDAVAGIVGYRQGYVDLAWDRLRRVPRATWTRHAAAEWARAGLAAEPDRALAEIRSLAGEDPPELRAKFWYDVLGPVFGMGAADEARAVYAVFDRHVREDDQAWSAAAKHRDWMRPWVAADPDSPTAPSPGRRTFAVLDYGHPSANRASANIGDHIQSIASLGHLVRHRNVRLYGDAQLVGLLERLRERTRPELRLEAADADLEVIAAHRDASTYQAIPEDTWTLAFGWYMHPLFNWRHAFPLHRNLRPIFISFHCNKRSLLTSEAIEYLRRYGPVGCRDWTTVYLLLSIGVPAFFSGCLTTTIDTVFPERPRAPDGAPAAYVDVEDAPDDAVIYHHSDLAVRTRGFVDNMGRALELLETYRTGHRRVVTSRLHCYLPVRSIGLDVEFRPKNPSDVRFDGLAGIDDRAFAAIREGIDDKLEQVLGAILAGRPEHEVYGLWREITADDVAAAERQRGVGAEVRRAALDVQPVLEATTTRGEAGAGTVHCAVVLPKGGGLDLAVLADSLLEHATRPLQLWVLAHPGTGSGVKRLQRRFPELAVGHVPLESLAGGPVRLLLADLLPGVDRVVVLPLPAVATADVAELAGLDLAGHAVAAPTRQGRDVSGFGVIHAAAARLGTRTEAAAALRRTAHARHAFDFDAFTGAVLVADLARLRERRLSAEAVPLAKEFELDDVEALHYVLGPGRAVVPMRWATVPTRMPMSGDGLIHWADRMHPSQPELTPERERWRGHAAAIRRRDG